MKKTVFVVALIAGIVGIIAHFISIQFVSPISVYLIMGGFVLLAIGYMSKHR